MVKVSQMVLEALEEVRDSGVCNMFDCRKVIAKCRSNGYEETAEWIRVHMGEYITGVMEGFEAEEDESC